MSMEPAVEITIDALAIFEATCVGAGVPTGAARLELYLDMPDEIQTCIMAAAKKRLARIVATDPSPDELKRML